MLIPMPKKVALFPEISQMKISLYSPARKVGCISEYIFLISKNKQTKKNKKTRTQKQKKIKKKKEYLQKTDLKK